MKIIGPTVYRIQDCKNTRKRKVVHFNRLKPAYYEHIPVSELPPPDEASDTNSTTNAVPAPLHVALHLTFLIQNLQQVLCSCGGSCCLGPTK